MEKIIKPIIAIASISVQDRSYPAVKGVRTTYIDSILEAGGIPVIVPQFVKKPAEIATILSLSHGVMFCGGTDISPDYYKAEKHPATEISDDSRDESEFELFAQAKNQKIPIFGICRGCQLINVACGGDLFQDLPSEGGRFSQHGTDAKGSDNVYAAHRVAVKSGTKLSQIFGATDLLVNSIHHQGIKKIGQELIASATAPDGLVEAIEHPTDYIVGVQWHPEIMWKESGNQLNPFISFVEAARVYQNATKAR